MRHQIWQSHEIAVLKETPVSLCLQVMLNNSNAGRIAPIGLEHAVLHGWKLAKDEAHQRASFLLMDINEITIINKLQIKKT